jgi:hypothetical protein
MKFFYLVAALREARKMKRGVQGQIRNVPAAVAALETLSNAP